MVFQISGQGSNSGRRRWKLIGREAESMKAGNGDKTGRNEVDYQHDTHMDIHTTFRNDNRNPMKGSLSMSVFSLAPQFLVIGFGDGFTLVGLQEYFYDQVPDSMRSLGIALHLSVIGAANFLSSWVITAVDHVTDKSGKSWFGKDLNSSRLDKFYWLLAAITTLNLFAYVFFARRYSYKNIQKLAVADSYDGETDDAAHGTMV